MVSAFLTLQLFKIECETLLDIVRLGPIYFYDNVIAPSPLDATVIPITG